MQIRTFALNIGVSLLSLLLFVGVIEIGLRATGLQTVAPNPPKIFEQSAIPAVSYELIPSASRTAYRNIVTTNSLGFRGPELTNKPLLAVFGDSITFGYGVADDETLPAQLQKQLSEYNVLNTAAPAYQLLQQTAILEKKILPLQPKGVILVFYWNDFTTLTPRLDPDGVLREQDVPVGGFPCSPNSEPALKWIPGQCWLQNHSAFYKAFVKLVRWKTGLAQLQQDREKSKSQPATDDVTAEDLQIYSAQLDTFVRFIPQGVPKLFVIWPDRFLHEQSRPKLRHVAATRGFTVVDLYDTFGNEVPVLGWDTVHPTAQALSQAADVVGKAWKELAVQE